MPVISKGAKKRHKKSQAIKQQKKLANAPVPLPNRGENREVLYEHPQTELCLGEKALTAAKAKQLLGWEEDETGKKFGADFHLIDLHEKKIRLYNNIINRPLYFDTIDKLKQEVLRKKWRFNFENIIIGKTGLILNGQHCLIGLVLAVQAYHQAPEKYAEWWDSEPVMEKSIGYGVEEIDEVINTMDTCKPRSLADVIYRSDYFAAMSGKDRRNVSRITAYCIKLLWHRTGAGYNAFGKDKTHQTHAESLDFVNRHPKVLEAVKHIYEHNDKQQISKYVSAGYAAAFLFLMGCASTDPAEYQAAVTPKESMLDFELWDQALEFWTLLSEKAKPFQAVREAIMQLAADDSDAKDERFALIVKAWLKFSEDEEIEEEDLELSYGENEDGQKFLDECPTVGGIDKGDPSESLVRLIADQQEPEEPEEDEDEEEAEDDDVEGTTRLLTKGKFKVGQLLNVAGENGEEGWQGTLVEVYQGAEMTTPAARIRIAKGYPRAGKIFEAPLKSISRVHK